MAEISTITLPDGIEYEIKDAAARAAASGAIQVRGATATALTDESTTNPIVINGSSYTAKANDAVFYNKKEFVFDGAKWHEFGDMSGLGTLATKNSASGSYTPEGTVSQTVTPGTAAACTFPLLVTNVENETLTFTWTPGTFTANVPTTVGNPVFNGTAKNVTVS